MCCVVAIGITLRLGFPNGSTYFDPGYRSGSACGRVEGEKGGSHGVQIGDAKGRGERALSSLFSVLEDICSHHEYSGGFEWILFFTKRASFIKWKIRNNIRLIKKRSFIYFILFIYYKSMIKYKSIPTMVYILVSDFF